MLRRRRIQQPSTPVTEGIPATAARKLPSPVTADLQAPAVNLWLDRLRQVFSESYVGIQLLKIAEDLRVYEHIIWSQRVSLVIELGAYQGASALWFRDRMRTLQQYGAIDHPQVISVDLDCGLAREQVSTVDADYADTISLVDGDVLDPLLPDRVRSLVRASSGACLVIDDTAHTRETTLAALKGFASFVTPGSYFVVEDGCVDIEEMRVDPSWPRGVLGAIDEWLGSSQGSLFNARSDLEMYGFSCHRHGYLQRLP